MGPLDGRPTTLVGRRPSRPRRLQASTCHSLIGSQWRFKESHAQILAEEGVAPLYKYEGRGSISKHPSNQGRIRGDVVSFSCRGLRIRGVHVRVVVRDLKVFMERPVCLLPSLYVML